MTEFQPYNQPEQHVLGRPQDLDAEALLLGSIIQRPERYDEVMNVVSSRDFVNNWHRWTWDVIADLIRQDVAVDKQAVVSGLNRYVEHSFGALTVEAFVDGMICRAVTPSNAKFYASLVAGDAIRRRICEVAPLLTGVANDFLLSVEEVREKVSAMIAAAMDEMENEGRSAHASDLAGEVIDEILSDVENGRKRKGASSGLADLDYVLSGLNPGEVVLIAARTSVGKSALALRIVETFCKRGDKVVYYSLEMSKSSLMERLLSMHTRIPMTLIRNRALNPLQQHLVANAKEVLSSWDLQIDEKVSVTPQYVRTRSRSYGRRRAIDLIVVDHMHIMEPTFRTGDDVSDLKEITKDLHNVARDLDVPVLTLAQLNRGPETRTGQEAAPVMRDLRGSGGIEENADVIIGIHRPDYRRVREPGFVLPEIEQAELHVLKNRNGPAGGMVAVTYKSECVRFDNCSDKYEQSPVPTIQTTAPTTQPPITQNATQAELPEEDPFAGLEAEREEWERDLVCHAS